MKNGNHFTFRRLDVAKTNCLANDNCVGLVDQRGEGKQFSLYNKPLIIRNSSIGGIFYQKLLKGIIRINAHNYIFNKDNWKLA